MIPGHPLAELVARLFDDLDAEIGRLEHGSNCAVRFQGALCTCHKARLETIVDRLVTAIRERK